MRKPLVAGNWKAHTTLQEAEALVRRLKESCDTDAVEVVVCPPFTALSAIAHLLQDGSIGLGAQDLFWEPQGAFTGEVSAPMLVDVGCRYVIIGHSERRTHFGETDQTVRRKLAAALQHALTAIVCIGETLAERETNTTIAVLTRQLDGALNACIHAQFERILLAYEPVWAIGTGRNATPEQAQESHQFIRGWVAKRFGSLVSDALRILYGGSVTAANAAGLLQQPDVDGALVGGASLKAEAFTGIVHAARDAKAVVR